MKQFCVASVCAAFAFAFFKRFSLTRHVTHFCFRCVFISLFITTPPPCIFLPLVVFFADLLYGFFFASIFGALYERENDWNVIKNCTANAAANAFSKRSPRAACSVPHAAYFVPREAASDGCKCFKAIWFSARNAGIEHTECAIVPRRVYLRLFSPPQFREREPANLTIAVAVAESALQMRILMMPELDKQIMDEMMEVALGL